MDQPSRLLPVESPEPAEREYFTDPAAAVARLEALYSRSTDWLLGRFLDTLDGKMPQARFRAWYPELRLTTASHSQGDSRLAFGHVALPGSYAATITRRTCFATI